MGPGLKALRYARALVTRTLEFEFERMPYRLEAVSTNKLLTLIRNELNSARSRPREPWYPVQLQVEPSSACTLQCTLCPAGMGAIDKPKSIMRPEVFRSLMNEVGDHAAIAVLWMWGEPFTNKHLPEMIADACRMNVATVTSTNGQHIQTREDAERLVCSGLDNLVVALDGATQETYSRYREGGDIRKIFRCLELIRQAKDSLGSDKPRVNVRTVVNKHNEHELEEIGRIARRYGADMVSQKAIFALDRRDMRADSKYTPESANHRNYKYVEGRSRACTSGTKWRCRRPWNRMTVDAQGIVLPCEFDYNHSEPFGTAGDGASFMQAWKSQRAASFRRQHMQDKMVYPFCVNCACGWIRARQNTTVEMVHLTDQSLNRCNAVCNLKL